MQHVKMVVTFLNSVSFTGDGRNDSPGHSAQHCTYTVIDADTMQVIHMITIDKRESKISSALLETECFQQALASLLDYGLNVTEVVTDAHSMIAAYMSK